ncbi:MAG: hypothetical protein JRI23_12660 [Deltaproteobacteria bacterium]|jgi:hypothetical protein|nr:hypothetical protein [Deltaproteobacteria bacterium]
MRWGIPTVALALTSAFLAAGGCWGSDYRKVDPTTDAGTSAGGCEAFTLVPPTQCEGDAYLADGENCCVPGRSCLGAGCDNGRCEATEVAYSPGGGEAIDVLVMGDDVLWSGGGYGELYRNSVDGPASPQSVGADPNDYVTALATDGQYVYWVEYGGGQIWRKDPDAPQFTEELVADTGTDQGGWGRITVHEDYAYFVTAGQAEESGATGNSVWRAAKDGSESSSPTRIHQGGSPHGVAVGGEHVYWTDRDNTAGGVYRLRLSDIGTSTAPESIASQESGLTDIAVHDGNLVWLDDGTVYTRSLAGGPITDLGTSSFGWSLAFDDLYVYWTDEYEGTLYRAALDGGGVVTQAFAYGQNPKGLAVGCKAVYFANWADNDPNPDWVSKVAK